MSTTENIHVRSFREFIERRLPEALGKVIPLTDYRADWTGDGRGSVSFAVGEDGPRITFGELPFPRPDGTFSNMEFTRSLIFGLTSSTVRLVCTNRTPQLMSKPTPPGDNTPSSESVAATPPMGKP